MMRKRYPLLFFTPFLIGMLFFCVYQEWLVIYWNKPLQSTLNGTVENKKELVLWVKKEHEWQKKICETIYSDTLQEKTRTLVQEWLDYAQDEQKRSTTVTVQSALFSPTQYELYISFDKNPFDNHWSIHAKDCFIQGILKTLIENNCPASRVYFLVNHKLLKDPHIDCSKPWLLTAVQ